MSAKPTAISEAAFSGRSPGFSDDRTATLILRAGLVLVAALYARIISFDFVYDDLGIQVSPLVQSWRGVADAFKSDIFAAGGQAGSSYYRPMASALCVAVARLTAISPAWYHLLSLTLALIGCVLAYYCGRLLFRNSTLAALTAVLFALHPTKVETTAFLGSGLCDGQVEIYFFATLICYLKWFQSRKRMMLAASLGFYALAMFTKETMVALPALVLIHAWLNSPREGRIARIIWLETPYAAVILFYMLARHFALGTLPRSSNAIKAQLTMANFWSAPSALAWYLKRLVFPTRLAILYDWTAVTAPTLQRFALPLMVVLVVVLAAGWAWYRTRSRQLVFLLAWFFLLILPPVVMAPGVTLHDRYLQLAAFPFCALLAWGAMRAIRSGPQTRMAGFVLLAGLIALWSLSTWHESGFWDNNLLLWQRAVQVSPRNVTARVELARQYAASDPASAVRLLDEGIKLLPDSPGLWRSRGVILFNADQYEQSRWSLLRALEVSAQFAKSPASEPPDVKFGRATCAFLLGEIEMVGGDFAAGQRWLQMAVDIDPENIDYNRVLATDLRKQGRVGEAEKYEQTAERLISRKQRPAK